MFKSILVTLVASSLVAAQSLPNLSGDCVSQCSALVNDLNSTCTDATDFASCYCGIYEKDLPGDCINCLNSVDPGTGQEIQGLIDYCSSGAYSSLTLSPETGVATVGPTGTTTAQATATDGTTGSTTATSSSTAKVTGTQHSSGSTTVVGMGFVGLVVMLGCAIV